MKLFGINGRKNLVTNRVTKIYVLIIFFIVYLKGPVIAQEINNTPYPQVNVHDWIQQHFSRNHVPPFSFVYGGKDSKNFITHWKYYSEQLKSSDPGVEKYLYTYADNQSGLKVKCFVTGYLDFHAVEWVLNFSNTSNRNTSILEKTDAINCLFSYPQKGTFILHHSNGSNAKRSDFMPTDDTLETGKDIILMPTGGRSSDNTAFPFFNIESPARQGILVAIGWTGKWYAAIDQKNENTITLKSGMERMKLLLYPKEEIRTPKISLLFWSGKDRMIGNNEFRQFILDYHTRKINGHHVELPLSAFLARGGPSPCNEHTCATESYAIAEINRFKQFNIVPEVFWLDAGWYSCDGFWPEVGNWTPNKENFPNGFKPVTDVAHKVGAKFILWFEPERVTAGTQFANKNPDWLIKLSGNKNFLFNLGDSNARLWLTNYLSDFIKKEGIDYYRQDFNMDPMPYWEKMDKPNRIGISEIRHIEGLYKFWDSLLVRFPNLIIDNCSSGGRRIDLETISRSSPLWRTDYQYGEPNGYQCHTYGLNFYLPLSGTSNVITTPYGFRSSMSSAMALMWDINSSNGSIPQMQKCIQDFKRLRPYYYGDYYPLTGTKNMLLDNVWLAYQLNRPIKGDGIIMAFRRKDSPEGSIVVKLSGLNPKSIYQLYNEDSALKMTRTGDELMRGIEISQQEQPGSLLIEYKEIHK